MSSHPESCKNPGHLGECSGVETKKSLPFYLTFDGITVILSLDRFIKHRIPKSMQANVGLPDEERRFLKSGG